MPVGGISVPQENLSPGQFFLGNDVRGTMYPRMICPPPGWIVPLEKVSGVSLALVVTLSCVLRIIFIVLVIVTLNCAPSICSRLALLFNECLSQGKVPADWKLSNITPIYKSGDDSLASNYRPISLLSLCSKLLERLVHNNLMKHIIDHKLLSDLQFGFRQMSSTQEAILSATHDWHKTLEDHGSVVCIFLDLAKAFDSLPHSLVLESLARVGVCGSFYDWFADYLTGRSQRVVLEGHSSSVASVTSGVPQGSILGPLLFSLSLDPIASVSISISAALGMFADDIVYWMRVFNDSDMLALQCDFDLLCDWIHNAGLRLNSQKTKCLVISRKRKPPCPSISVNGSVIEQVSSFKYLGVTISSDLSWSPHVANICCNAKKLLGFLYRGFRFADRSCLAHLY